MRRAVALLIAVALAGVIVWVLAGTLGGVGEEESAGHRDEILGLVEQGDLEQARAEFERLRNRLTEVDLAFVEGGVLLGEGEADEAVARLGVAYEARRTDARILDYLAGALMDAGRQDEAWDLAKDHLKTAPTDRQVLWVTARTAFVPTDAARCRLTITVLEQLDREIQRAIEANEEPGVHVLQYLHLWANASLGAGQYRAAVQQAVAAVSHDKSDVASYLLLAAVARRVAQARNDGQARELAASAYREAVRLDPRYEVLFDAAQFLMDVPDAESEGLALAERLYRDYPDRSDAAILYARALVRQGKNPWMDEAVGIYERQLEKRPEDPVVLRNLAVLYYDWKQGGQRGRYLRQAHELLRRYQKAGGEMDESLAEVYATLDGFAAGDAAASKAASAHAAMTRGDMDEALRLYREATAADPSRVDYPVQLVGLLLYRADLAEELESRSRNLYARFRDETRAVRTRALAILARLGPIEERKPTEEVLLRAASDLCTVLAEHAEDEVLTGQVALVLWMLGGSQEREALRTKIPELAGLGDSEAERVFQAVLTLESQ